MLGLPLLCLLLLPNLYPYPVYVSPPSKNPCRPPQAPRQRQWRRWPSRAGRPSPQGPCTMAPGPRVLAVQRRLRSRQHCTTYHTAVQGEELFALIQLQIKKASTPSLPQGGAQKSQGASQRNHREGKTRNPKEAKYIYISAVLLWHRVAGLRNFESPGT